MSRGPIVTNKTLAGIATAERLNGKFLIIETVEHGPKVPVMPEYIVLAAGASAKTGVYVSPN
jgi:hypothetical protein